MKLSETTFAVLANMAKINPHIVIPKGNVLKTVNEKKTVVVTCSIEETFDVEVALHDLSGFLRVVKMFNDPDFEFGEKSVIISDDIASQEYFYSDKEDLVYEERDVNVPDGEINITISHENLVRVTKAAGVNGVEDIAVVGEKGEVYLKALDKEKPKRTFAVRVDEEDHGEFTAYMKHSKKGTKLDFLAVDYQVNINSAKVAKFKNDDIGLTYILALESDSVFADS